MASESFSSGSSSSSSTMPDYPQSPFLMQLAQYAQMLGQASKQWADQEYAKTSALTDQTVSSYLNTNAKAMALAQNNVDRYTQLFQPQENALIRDANTYASPDRLKADMGAAASGQAQAGDAAIANTRRELQSFGIDPSAGRYADMEQASRVKTAAAAAGAAQQQRIHDENTGRALRSEAIQVGERYPGQIINSLNTGLQSLTGAENARLGNANTGKNLEGLPNDYLRTASELKYPPLGNNSQSQQHSQGSSSDPDRQSGQRSGSGSPSYGGQDYGSGSSSSRWDNPNNYTQDEGGSRGGYGGMRFDSRAKVIEGDDEDGAGWDKDQWFDPGAQYPKPEQQTFSDSNSGSSDTYGSDWMYGAGDSSNGGSGGDFSGGDTADSFAGSDWDYAEGGAIPDGATTGGHVNPAMSPSGGQQTDDVNAHLNADEFVIPADVVRWKGQEFFQKMIQQARASTSSAPARGKPGPSRPGPAQFRSQAIG